MVAMRAVPFLLDISKTQTPAVCIVLHPGDILAGTTGQCNGLLCELFNVQPDRRLVIAAVALLVCAPALANKSLEALSLFNALGVLAVALLGAAVAALAVAAVAQGRGCSVPLWPQWGAFGKGGFEVAMGVASVVPVVLSCYVGHQVRT